MQCLFRRREGFRAREQLARLRLQPGRLRQEQDGIARFSGSHLPLAQRAQRGQVLAVDGVVQGGGETFGGTRRRREGGEISGAPQRDAASDAERMQGGGGEREDLRIRFRARGADQLATCLQPLVHRPAVGRDAAHDAPPIVQAQGRHTRQARRGDPRHLRREIRAQRDEPAAAVQGAECLGPEDVRGLDRRRNHLGVTLVFEAPAERRLATAQAVRRLEEEVLRSREWSSRLHEGAIVDGGRRRRKGTC